MNIAVFSSKTYDQQYFDRYNQTHNIKYFSEKLDSSSLQLIKGFPAVCAFVNDDLNRDILTGLQNNGVRIIALRCAGYNNLDIKAANELGIIVVHVPAYSPNSVAEHAVALMLTLNRKTHYAFNRIKECNYSLDGLMGFDLFGKNAGIIGTGKIGTELVKILTGFGMTVYATDIIENKICNELGVKYVSLSDLLKLSDVISIHCPLTTDTNYLINKDTINKMKKGVMLINTSRGAIIDTMAVIGGLKDKTIGYLGLDVYEHEADLFFTDLSEGIVKDVCLQQLLNFDNVLITGHQAFFTDEAMTKIAMTTLESISDFENGKELTNQVSFKK